MKYLFALCFILGVAHAQESNNRYFETGTPPDCMIDGTADDQADDYDRTHLQKKITDCMGPLEEEKNIQIDIKQHGVVSQ